MKKFFALILTLLFTCCFIFVPASAAEQPSSVYKGSIDLTSLDNISVSEPMTYEEMVHHYAANEGITFDEARELLPPAIQTFSMRGMAYRTFTATLDVTGTYKPHLEFYCVTAEGGHFFNIESIYSVQLVRSSGNISKQFAGEVNVWLRSTHSIEYVVNGDFYNNGTTSSSGGIGLNLGIDELCTVSFSASSTETSNHFKYYYVHRTANYGN